MSKKLSIVDVIAVLNANDVAAVPRLREDGSAAVMVSAVDADGKRFFLNRVASSELNPDGTARYIWVRGKEMVRKTETATEAVAA